MTLTVSTALNCEIVDVIQERMAEKKYSFTGLFQKSFADTGNREWCSDWKGVEELVPLPTAASGEDWGYRGMSICCCGLKREKCDEGEGSERNC